MSDANAISDLERAEHLGYADGKGVKRVSIFNDGVQINAATEEKQDSLLLVKNPGQTLYDKDSTGLLYKGYNASPDAAQSATDWLIIKYVKTSGSLVQKITRTGSWTGRVALF